MTDQKRTITAKDLYTFELVSSMEISPDGKHIVYAQHRVNPENEKKFSNLWVVSTADGTPRQFTFGDQVDRAPKWSPDGSQIAFLSNRGDEKQFQIYILPFFGGEARPLTEIKGSFNGMEWSPDGSRLACQIRLKDEDAIQREADEKQKKLGIVERHIQRISYKYDGMGFLPKERWHLAQMPVEANIGRQSPAPN